MHCQPRDTLLACYLCCDVSLLCCYVYYATTATADIMGAVWDDVSGEGIRNVSETSGLANVLVELIKDTVVVGTTLTDANGAYAFLDLLPGSYSLRFSMPSPDQHITTTSANALDPITLVAGQVMTLDDVGITTVTTPGVYIGIAS